MGNFAPGSGIEIPGLEGILEYGDSSSVVNDRIASAVRINDRSVLEQIRVKNFSGLHDDPDGRDTRDARSDRHGEDAGLMLYGGRTIGLTGEARAGSIDAMRDVWNKFRSQFGVGEHDLLVHPRLEVPLFVNELPGVVELGSGWLTVSSGSTTMNLAVADGTSTVGEMVVTGLSGSASSFVTGRNTPYDGRDIYVCAAVKIHSASATVTSVTVGVIPDNSSGIFSTSKRLAAATLTSPTTGTWYFISGRISAADLLSVSPHSQLNFILTVATTGTSAVTLRFEKPTQVFLNADDPTPIGWISSDSPGYEFETTTTKTPGLSRSYGPCYAVNQITDPLCQDATKWTTGSTGSPTITTGPTTTTVWHGDLSPSSIFLDATQATINTTLYLIGQSTPVIQAHTYRLSCKIKALINDSGTIDASIRWIDRAGTTVSSSSQSLVGTGEFDVSVTATVPATAVAAVLVVGYDVTHTTGATQRLQIALSDPSLIDVTYFDSGDFVGNGPARDETLTTSSARRRIPRPFLIRKVRKTSDAKAPEQQSGPNAWRDFTMSLRAADPRLYVLDQRNTLVKMTGTPKFFAEQTPTDFTLETAGLAVPTGWTYEGHNITPGAGMNLMWSRQGTYRSPFLGNLDPNNGVSLKSWDNSSSFGTGPAASISPRMYRSLESYTYTKPRVVLGGAPSMTDSFSGTPDAFSFLNVSGTIYCSTATILLKRVSSTTWLELRWNSVSRATHGVGGGPFAFELWCSHNTSGTLATTKLASWDYSSYDSSHGVYPFKPSVDPQWLVSWLDASNVVHWELWNKYPSVLDMSGRYESGSFTLSASLIALVGAAVAGHAGRSMTIQQTSSGSTNYSLLAGFPPFWHYFESSAFDVPPVTVTSPVIGDIDTPQVIKLRGGLVDPVIQISVPEYDGLPARTSVARMKGTTDESNPVTIDLTDGSITDSLGNNRYDLLLPGFGDFAAFRPGQNYVSIQATNWDSDNAHATISWRDALR